MKTNMRSFVKAALFISLFFYNNNLFAAEKTTDAVNSKARLATLSQKKTIDLGDIVVTPSGTDEYIYNLNRNVTVIDGSTIEQSNDKDIQNLINGRTGIILSSFFGNQKDNALDFRGFGSAGSMNYLVLIDGRRTNQIDLSGADLAQIDINGIKRIELLRGASSVLYGDNATGGVINIITKKGRKGYHLEYEQTIGSFQGHKELISASGGHDFMDYFISYSYQDTNGYRVNNGYEADDILANFTLKPADMFEVLFSFIYHRDWYGQPGAMYAANLNSDGRTGSRFPDSKAKTEDYSFTAVPKVFLEGNLWEGVASALISVRSRRTNSLDVSLNRYETNHHITTLEFKPKYEMRFFTADESIDNKLVTGFDYYNAKDQILSGDVVYRKSQVDITKETFAFYANDNILLNKKFIFNAGIRGEWAKYIFDQTNPSDFYFSKKPEEVAYEAGFGYKYNDSFQIYFNYAHSFRFPATDEFFQSAYESLDWWTGTTKVFPATLNTALKQQVGDNFEIGIKDTTFDKIKFYADYYLMVNKNEIYYDPIEFINKNYEHTIHHGFEVEAYGDFFDKVKPYISYSFQKAFFVGGPFASKTIPLVPAHKFTGGVDIYLLDGLVLNANANYTGSRYVTNDQINELSKLESYMLFNIGISYEIKNFTFFVGVKNLTDVKYFSNATKNFLGNPAFYPGLPRTFEFQVKYKI